MNDDRAQSSSVGAILLVGVVTLTVSTYGVFYLADVTDGNDDPVVEVDGTVTNESVSLTHAAGDVVEESKLRVQFSVDGTAWTNVTWAGGTPPSDGDGTFEPGETWTDDVDLSPDDRVELWLIHEPTGTVLYHQR